MRSAILPLSVLVASWLAFAGCSRHGGMLGQFEMREPISISSAAKQCADTSLNVAGKLVQKCPVAGCWFYLEDQTGRMKIHTKNAGFVVLEVPLGTCVEVTGKLRQDGVERMVEAQGLKF